MKTQTIQKLQTENQVEQFAALLMSGMEAWIKAGKIASDAIEDDPDFADKVHEKHPEISVDTVYAFDRIGRGLLHPKLAISDSPGALRLRRLPMSLQEKYISEPVRLLIKNGEKWESLQVSVFNLEPNQAAQIFDGSQIRNEAQQRTWLENKSASKTIIQFDEPFRVSGRKLVVMQPCQLTAKQLANILAQME